MSIPRLGRLVLVGASVIMPVLLSGCGSGGPTPPRADQAGHILAAQVYKMLIGATVIHVKISDPLFDKYVPCADGKAKLTYAVSGTATTFAGDRFHYATRTETKTKAAPHEIIEDMVSYLPQIGTFSVTRSDNATAQLVSPETYTRLTIHSPGPNKLAITGETNCLRSSGRLEH